EVDLPVQVIALVLDDARVEALRDEAERLPVAAVRLDPDLRAPRNHAAEVRDAQAPLPVLLLVLGEERDLRVHEDGERDRLRIGIARVRLDAVDDDAPRDV